MSFDNASATSAWPSASMTFPRCKCSIARRYLVTNSASRLTVDVANSSRSSNKSMASLDRPSRDRALASLERALPINSESSRSRPSESSCSKHWLAICNRSAATYASPRLPVRIAWLRLSPNDSAIEIARPWMGMASHGLPTEANANPNPLNAFISCEDQPQSPLLLLPSQKSPSLDRIALRPTELFQY